MPRRGGETSRMVSDVSRRGHSVDVLREGRSFSPPNRRHPIIKELPDPLRGGSPSCTQGERSVVDMSIFIITGLNRWRNPPNHESGRRVWDLVGGVAR